MTWREKIALLLGASAPFALGDAHAVPTAPSLGPHLDAAPIERDAWTYTDPAQQQRLMRLAGHSSHASHASHASHYSGSGSDVTSEPSSGDDAGYSSPSDSTPRYTAPIPAPAPPPLPPAPPAEPDQPHQAVIELAPNPQTPSATATPSSGRFSQAQIRIFVQRVQLALIALGYDPGPADGSIGGKTKDALKAYQTSVGLPATGFLDIPTLRRMGLAQ
jgi:His-Xaa-Ser repeat protein HxsA